jgi:hypothetical protein
MRIEFNCEGLEQCFWEMPMPPRVGESIDLDERVWSVFHVAYGLVLKHFMAFVVLKPFDPPVPAAEPPSLAPIDEAEWDARNQSPPDMEESS